MRNISTLVRIDRGSGHVYWRMGAPFFAGQHAPVPLPTATRSFNEGQFGRFFEVTLNGETVWEYVNPHFGPTDTPPEEQTNSVFRALRYTAEQIAAWSA
jgi:hypothetical protein